MLSAVQPPTLAPMEERVILVTGATDGLGRGIALDLAARGATVLLHGRSGERLEATLEAVRTATGKSRIRVYRGDFESFEEVRALADSILASEDRLDGLVNNAGIGDWYPGEGERVLVEGGIEIRFQVNYLAHFLLTRRLLPLLRGSAPARIVNVTSGGQQAIDFEDPMLTRDYSGWRAYCQSKLAQILFTFDLSEELAGSGVSAVCLHPASLMPTKIVGSPTTPLSEGVDATVRLVLTEEDFNGWYLVGTEDAWADAQAYDPEARAALRRLSEELTGEGPPG